MQSTTAPLHLDRLEGVDAIADFIYGRADKKARRRTQYMCERGLIPCGKIGRLWVGSRRKIQAHLDAVASGEPAA